MSKNYEATSLRDLLCASIDSSMIGTTVTICGWVAKRREHGEHLAFLDVRDRSGIVQAVVDGSVDVRSEYVVRITGTVSSRPEGTVNDRLATGEIELSDCTVEVLAAAEPPPSNSTTATTLTSRSDFVTASSTSTRGHATEPAPSRGGQPALRRAMDAQGFCEVETPLLWAPTPRAPGSSSSHLGFTPASSTCCPRAPSSPSSC